MINWLDMIHLEFPNLDLLLWYVETLYHSTIVIISTGQFSRLRSSLDDPFGLRSEPISPPPNVPKGLYLYGDVGTGKTMLMDLFYSTLPPEIKRKRRVHFHAFMIDVHKRIHAVKASAGNIGDPILPVARDLANEASVLCFDEFQVRWVLFFGLR